MRRRQGKVWGFTGEVGKAVPFICEIRKAVGFIGEQRRSWHSSAS
jgi:hypothetical protein